MRSLVDFFAHVIDTYNTDAANVLDLVYLEFRKTFDKDRMKD